MFMTRLLLLLILPTVSVPGFSQNIGIGTATPHPSAALEIKSSSMGLLIPGMTQAQRNAISSPATGLLIFQTDAIAGFYYNSGTPTTPNWTVPGAGGSSWQMTGNSGTNPAVNFIGTTDMQPLRFRIQNVNAGFIDSATNNTAIGFRALDSVSSGAHNTAFGISSLISNSDGNYNTGLGSFTLRFNKSGTYNTASGYVALRSNTTGSFNTATGALALYALSTGNYNSASGYSALRFNTSGIENTAMGAFALFSEYKRFRQHGLRVWCIGE